jgi:hypothetical protein
MPEQNLQFPYFQQNSIAVLPSVNFSPDKENIAQRGNKAVKIAL